MKQFKRVWAWVLTVCLVAGMLVPGSLVRAVADSVDYSMIDARTLYGKNFDNIETEGFIDWSKSQYDSGKLNWYVLAHNNNRTGGETKLTNSYGMRLGGNVDSWIAFVIKAPGTGTYTMQTTHSESAYGADLALAYIMPMSASVNADVISDTVHNGAALGTVDFYSATASGYNNKTTTLGSYSFTAGEEYVLILYASEGYQITGSTAYMIFSKFTAVKGSVSATADTQINPVNLGAMVMEFGMRGQIALREVNGYDYYFMPIKGGQMHIYNLDYYCDGDSTTEPYITSVSTGFTNTWGCSAGEDGKIYVTGDDMYVYRYDPDTGKGEKLTYATSYVCGYDVGADAAGNIYIGVNKSDAGVAYYDNATATFKYYYGLDPNGVANDCSAVAWDSEFIYAYLCGNAGGSSTQIIVKINKSTGRLVNYKDVSAKVGNTGHLTGMNVVDGVLFAGSNGLTNMIAIDVDTWGYVNVGVSYGIKGDVSEEQNGKVYFVASDHYVYSYDIANRKATKLNISANQCFYTNQNSFVTLDVDNNGVDEDVILSCRPDENGSPLLYDITAQKAYRWTDIINTKAGAYVPLRDIYASNDGSNNIYVGAYSSNDCAAYNTNTENYVNYIAAGQTDSQLMYQGVLYAGNYSTCTLAEINVSDGTYRELTSLSAFSQKRIHALAGGENKIFFSTVPDSYDFGGYLAWYDLNTGSTYSAKLSDLDADLADEMVLSMAYSGGYLYCGTTVRGGDDAKPTKTTSHLFVFDVTNKKVVAIEEIAYPYVASLDADSSGTVWGVISKTLFTVSYQNGGITFIQKFSNETGTLLDDTARAKEAFSTDAWFCKTIFFGSDGYLYVVLGNTGLWKIAESGTGTLISSAITGRLYALGEDGNIYYGSEKNLYLLPLSTSGSDISAAAPVNSYLDSALKSIPANSGSDLALAQEAYEKLTNVQKSLVDEAKLNAAKRRLAIALINDLPETVTMGNAGAVAKARSAYDALSESQRSRVTNYQLLVDAESKLSQMANVVEVEKLIWALDKEIYLTTEAEIQNAWAAYRELTEEQKAWVSADALAILTKADTTLAALKQEIKDAETVLVMDLHVQSQTLAASGFIQTVITGAAKDKYTLSVDFATTADWTCEVWLDDTLVGTLQVSQETHSFNLGVSLDGNHTLTLKNITTGSVEVNAQTLSLTAYMSAAEALVQMGNDFTKRFVKLQSDATVNSHIRLVNNSELDLNGNILTISDDKTILVQTGKIFDGASKINGDTTDALGGIKGNVQIIDENNGYMPLQDGDICRFYYYEAEAFDSGKNPYRSSEYLLFWFGIEFSNVSAYDLIELGESGMEVYATLSWTTKDGGGSSLVRFDSIVTQWAGGAVDKNYSMVVVVTGEEYLLKGDVITVLPEFVTDVGVMANIGESLSFVATGRLTMVAFHGVFGSEWDKLIFVEEE